MKFNLKKATSSLSEIKFRILWWYKLKPEIKNLKLRKPEINRKWIYFLGQEWLSVHKDSSKHIWFLLVSPACVL